jgi:hypothetical protein
VVGSVPRPAAVHSPRVVRLLRPQVVLSLCDYSGVWSQPYVDDDYDVIRIDLKHGQDVRLMKLPTKPIYGILAAPPCTVFAGLGEPLGAHRRRHARGPVDRRRLLPAGARNPPEVVGAREPRRQARPLPRAAAMTFNPNDYGDPYTKRTCLWGEFNTPVRTPVEATEGSKMHLRTARPRTAGDPLGDAGGLRPRVLRGEPVTDPIDVLAFGLPSTAATTLPSGFRTRSTSRAGSP